MNSEKKEEQVVKRSAKTSDLLIAFGVGLTVAAAAATTVYFVKTQRKKELKALKYGDEGLVKTYTERLYGYWGLTVKTFTAVTTVISDYLKPSSEKEMSPFVDSNAAYANPIHDDEGDLADM